MNKLLKKSGVFLFGAKNGDGLYHMFVLEVRDTNIYVFDELLKLMNELVSINILKWIVEWKIVVKGTKGSHPNV